MFQLPTKFQKNKDKIDKEVYFEQQGRWAESAINRSPLVRPAGIPKSVIIHDDTLREGMNHPGLNVSEDMKMKIAEKLEEAGVREVEAGYSGIKEHAQFMKRLKHSGSKMRLGSHILAGGGDFSMGDFRKDVDSAVDAGVDVISYLIIADNYFWNPVLDEDALIDRVQECIRYSKERGMFTAVGPCSYSFSMIRKIDIAAMEAGADRIYVYDYKGWYTPEAVSFIVKFVREAVGDKVPIAFHAHDDFGLATMNTVAATIAGATLVDVNINNLGHRCGNADFAETVLALETLYGVQTGIDLSKIYSLCKLVEEITGVLIPPNKPHIGANMYVYCGIHPEHLRGGTWWVMENVKAETIGHQRTIQWTPTVLDRGGLNGPVAHKAEDMGFALTEGQLAKIYDKLREIIKQRKYATDDEMEKIIRDVITVQVK
jgi:isopropylmalate/homocitrate/citramalate synthase